MAINMMHIILSLQNLFVIKNVYIEIAKELIEEEIKMTKQVLS